MNLTLNTPCSLFAGSRCLAHGPLASVAPVAKRAHDERALDATLPPVLLFADASSETIDLDWRGSEQAFAERLAALLPAAPASEAAEAESGDPADDSPRGPGRPRLGVVAREVTLLPRHWEWLATQPGGASVALRKLVEVARRSSEVKDRVRQASAVGYKFMSTMAGHEAGFEEASRALFAGDQAGFEAHIAHWPPDVQAHLKRILADAFWA
jgi:hypothetical protein